MFKGFLNSVDPAQIALGVLGAIGIALALANPFFLQSDNLQNLARSIGFFSIFAIAQMLAILVRGLDLSQGGMVALTSVLAALISQSTGWPIAFAICLLVGAMYGLAQGILIGRFGLSAFVVSLGGGSILAGAALLISKGQTIYQVPSGYDTLGWTNIVGFPLVFVSALIVLTAVWFLLNRLSLGREIYAAGSNPDAAYVIGVPVTRATVVCYIFCSALTALGAVILSSRITSGSPVIGGDTALQSIAAAVVGGVSLFGGKGSAIGVFIGAAVLAVLANLLNLYNISSYWQSVLFGVVIILAVVFDRLRLAR